MTAEGWYRDPYEIHEYRWLSDGHPTRLVRDQGTESLDEPPHRDLPLPLVPAAEVEASEGRDLLRADEPAKEKRNIMDGSGSLGVGFN